MPTVLVERVALFYNEVAQGSPLLLIHGSGPDVDDGARCLGASAEDARHRA
jgi:hypothetical protein